MNTRLAAIRNFGRGQFKPAVKVPCAKAQRAVGRNIVRLSERRQVLVCRWHINAVTQKLECHWRAENVEACFGTEPDPQPAIETIPWSLSLGTSGGPMVKAPRRRPRRQMVTTRSRGENAFALFNSPAFDAKQLTVAPKLASPSAPHEDSQRM